MGGDAETLLLPTGLESGQDHYHGRPIVEPLDEMLRKLALLHLRAIGVSGTPPDPATEFDQLDDTKLNAAWLSGAVHPISLRGMAELLMAALPKQTLTELGVLFVEAGETDRDHRPALLNAMLRLQSLQSAGLDQFPNEPFVSINPAASERLVTEAVGDLLKEWKGQRGLKEKRDRSDKYSEYIEVWDLREGWNAGHYDWKRERRFESIAQQTKRPIQTVHNQYQRAFELIVGHPYSASLWWKLFGLLKLGGQQDELINSTSSRRPIKDRAVRDVPESRLLRKELESTEIGVVSGASQNWVDDQVRELQNDILTLIAEGRTDEAIVNELELFKPENLELIAWFRSHCDEPE